MAKQKDDRTWVKDHFAQLEAIAEKVARVGGGLTEEVGPWSVLKQLAIHNVLGVYLPIISGQPWAKTKTFIDTNASCGVNLVRGTKYRIAGSSLIAAAARTRFDQYFFIEKDARKCDVLRERLTQFLPTGKFEVLQGTADERLPEVMRRVPTWDAHYFAVVDPYTLSAISWDGLKTLLGHPRGDVLINFQTTHFKRGTPEVAEAFCGTPDVRALIERNAPEDEFLSLFQARIRNSRPVQETIRIKTGESRYYYDFIYATAATKGNNPWMKAMGPVKKRVERLTGKGVMNILENKGLLDSFGEDNDKQDSDS